LNAGARLAMPWIGWLGSCYAEPSPLHASDDALRTRTPSASRACRRSDHPGLGRYRLTLPAASGPQRRSQALPYRGRRTELLMRPLSRRAVRHHGSLLGNIEC